MKLKKFQTLPNHSSILKLSHFWFDWRKCVPTQSLLMMRQLYKKRIKRRRSCTKDIPFVWTEQNYLSLWRQISKQDYTCQIALKKLFSSLLNDARQDIPYWKCIIGCQRCRFECLILFFPLFCAFCILLFILTSSLLSFSLASEASEQ